MGRAEKQIGGMFYTALMKRVLAVLLAGSALGGAEPTAIRSWLSTAGTKIEAKATACDGTSATFETPAGRVLNVELDKLAPADRELLRNHFGKGSGGTASEAAPPVDLGQPVGTVVGPIEAQGSHYFLYLPKSLKAGRKAPMLFFTHSGGGDKGRMRPMLEGSEICGWIVAMSVESKNGMDKTESVVHSKRCVEHLLKTLPVDPKRVYFSGISGGSREAFYNSSQMDSAGVLAIIAGGLPDELSRSKDYFFISGAYDFNRYDSSRTYAAVKSSSAFRFHPGKHHEGPATLVTEGMVWLESKVRQKGKQAAGEEFGLAAVSWAEGLKAKEPYRAAWWASRLLDGSLSGQARMRAETLRKEVASSPESIAYSKGLADLEKFAIDVLAEGPTSSAFDHTTDEIQSKADRLLKEHATTPQVKEIIEGLKQKTDRL
jgi:hypothetical protein